MDHAVVNVVALQNVCDLAPSQVADSKSIVAPRASFAAHGPVPAAGDPAGARACRTTDRGRWFPVPAGDTSLAVSAAGPALLPALLGGRARPDARRV